MKQFRVVTPTAFLSFVRQNKCFLVLTLSVAIGLLIGSICAGDWFVSSKASIPNNIYDAISIHSHQSYWAVFWHSLGSGLPFMLTVYVAGLFVLGTPIAAVVPLLYGIGSGAACGFLYVRHGLKGTAFCMLNLMPPMFANILLLVVASCDAIAFSRSLASCYICNTPAVLPRQRFKQYHIRFSVYSILFVGIALFDGLLTIVFSEVFVF